MATKKTTKATSPAKSDPNAFKVVESKDTRSQALAKLVTGGVLSAATLKVNAAGASTCTAPLACRRT